MSEPESVEVEPPRCSFTLYVAGGSQQSRVAIETVRKLCAEMNGEIEVEIIDVREEPALIVRDCVFAAPTLIKRVPPPLRRLIGDLSDIDSVRLRLDLGLPRPAWSRLIDE